MVAKFSLQPLPQREHFLRPDGGALESEEMGPFSMKLLLISHWRHFYTWRPRLCDYLRSSHIGVTQINKSLIAVDVVRTVMGTAPKDFVFGRWGLSFWRYGGLLFSVHLNTNGVTADILHTVKRADWIDCLL